MTGVQWVGVAAFAGCLVVVSAGMLWGLFTSDARKQADREELDRIQRRLDRELHRR